MSGSVRWERVSDFGGTRRVLRSPRVLDDGSGDYVGCVDRLPDGRWLATFPEDGAEHVTRRRSDAKRWLVARAAGLAEVPRMLPPPFLEYAAPRARLPRGWRVALAAHLTTGEPVTFYARNWERR